MNDLQTSFEAFTKSLKYTDLKLINTEYQDEEEQFPIYTFAQTHDLEAEFPAAEIYIARYDDFHGKWTQSSIKPRIENYDNGEFNVDFYLYACNDTCPNETALAAVHHLIYDANFGKTILDEGDTIYRNDFGIQADDEDMETNYNVMYKNRVIATYEDTDYAFQLGDGSSEVSFMTNLKDFKEEIILIENDGDVSSRIVIRINRI